MHEDKLLLLLLPLLPHRSFSTAIENNQYTTSCSGVNISYPFQLKGNPKGCGDPNYERACINNRTILDLNLSKYYVWYIDYNNFTIRIADVGLQKGNCSSLPHHFLSCSDFWYKLDLYRCGEYDYDGPKLSKTVAIVDCMKAVDSQFYIDASSCLDRVEFSNFSSTRRRAYVMVDPNVSYVETTCTIKHMAMMPWWADGDNLHSYAQIHDLMVYGFELSWLPIACSKMYCKGYFWCEINDQRQIQCMSKKGKFITNCLFFVGWVMEMISLWGIVPFIVVKFILGAPCVMMLLIRKWRRRHLAMDQNVEEFLQSNNNFLPIRYSYLDIKKIAGVLRTN